MRITFPKLELSLNTLFHRLPLLPLQVALAATIVAGCGSGATPSTPGTAGSSGGAGTTGSAGTAGTAGTSGSAGTSGTAGTTGTAGTSGTAGNGGGGGTAGGAQAGRGGSSAGTTGTAGAGGRGGGGGTTGTGGSASLACPASATFCSGFDDASQPAGSVYKLNGDPATPWTRDFAIDTAMKKNGNSALRVKSGSDTSTSGSAYKMLAVPATTGAFWARFWFRSDVDLCCDHNPFTMASPNDMPDKTDSIEFAEDVGLSFNTNDVVRWPTGYGRLTSGATNPYVLPKDTWYCIEISFDGTNRVQQLFVNGTQQINATNYPATALTPKIFKFGFWSIHGPNRQVWYDDVAVTPARIGGCP